MDLAGRLDRFVEAETGDGAVDHRGETGAKSPILTESRFEAGELTVEIVDDLGERASLSLDTVSAFGQRTKQSRNPDDGHDENLRSLRVYHNHRSAANLGPNSGVERMPYLSICSTADDTAAALDDISARLASQWTGDVDLAVVFFSGHHLPQAGLLAKRLDELTRTRVLIGCPGETIIEADREIEQAPALAVWLAKWTGDVRLTPFHLTFERTADGASLLGWPDGIEDVDPERGLLLTLGDPFTFPTEDFLEQANDERPGLAVVGGMASASREPGVNRLLLGGSLVDEGAVGVLLQGDVPFRTIVSQGCRPIGKPMIVTRAQNNFLLELGGKPALGQLQELWQQLDERDRELVQNGLHIGRVMNEYQGTFDRGDFLIRNVMGIDQANGAVAITDRVRVGQTVQFHVRDAATADEDLAILLRADESCDQPRAGLLFSCNGRGTRLFDEPNHDAKLIRSCLGDIPLAGFFAMGELGPIGQRNFIHGFTASLLVFGDS